MLVGRAVQVDHHLIEGLLIGHVHADKLGRDDLVYVFNRRMDA
ncbi:hypothetical protein SDC9_177482 [bioreactor metagenome]|uniref:Uncharacterized protein n=1 Tax=bioreactor metagenome TaxID=1076179 RepID=A0A645GTD2_9ZZZZ